LDGTLAPSWFKSENVILLRQDVPQAGGELKSFQVPDSMIRLHVLVSDTGKNYPEKFADPRALGYFRLLMPYHELFVHILR
jgi:hypothetical protein